MTRTSRSWKSTGSLRHSSIWTTLPYVHYYSAWQKYCQKKRNKQTHDLKRAEQLNFDGFDSGRRGQMRAAGFQIERQELYANLRIQGLIEDLNAKFVCLRRVG